MNTRQKYSELQGNGFEGKLDVFTQDFLAALLELGCDDDVQSGGGNNL